MKFLNTTLLGRVNELDEDQARVARILSVILISTLIINSIYSLILIFTLADYLPPISANFYLLLVQLVSLYYLRSNKVRIASIIDLAGTWIYFCFMILILGGSRSPGLVGFFLIILMAGLLLNNRAAYIAAIASSIFGIFILILETRGDLPQSIVNITPFYLWVTFLLGLAVTAILLNLATNNLNKSILAARQNAHELGLKNKELEKTQATLNDKIVELYEVSAALRRNEEYLKTVVQNAPVILWGTNEQGDMTFLKGRTLSNVEILPDQFVGDSIFDVLDGYTNTIEDNIAKALLGESNVSIEHLKDRTFEIHYSPMTENDVILGVIGVAIDVTERHAAEEALFKAQKIESLGHLAGGIAHDFNNLLVAILGQNSIAKIKLDADHPARKHVERAITAAKHASGLTQQMLAFSGKGNFLVSQIDLNQIIRDNYHLFETAATKRILFDLSLSDQPPIIQGDLSKIQQVIMNLIINAAESIETDSGVVTIATGIHAVDDESEVERDWSGRLIPIDRYAFVEVVDTGKGMSAETLQKIFDPFFTTKKTGHGLGLAAVQGIVRAHKGFLNVTSQVDHGSQFKLLFPLFTHSLQTIIPKKPQARLAVQSEMMILLIDDDEAVCQTITDILSTKNVDVISANNGYDGINLYKSHQHEINLVILDLTMPELSGNETLSRLRAIDRTIPILLASGYDRDAVVKKINLADVQGFIQKPFDAETLHTKIAPFQHPTLPEAK